MRDDEDLLTSVGRRSVRCSGVGDDFEDCKAWSEASLVSSHIRNLGLHNDPKCGFNFPDWKRTRSNQNRAYVER